MLEFVLDDPEGCATVVLWVDERVLDRLSPQDRAHVERRMIAILDYVSGLGTTPGPTPLPTRTPPGW
jgi:hypothetical protein